MMGLRNSATNSEQRILFSVSYKAKAS